MKRAAAGLLLLLGITSTAVAEPIFLSRQYARCTTCHYSPSGGGALTPYGRALSREELSTFGAGGGAAEPGREHEFLFGLLGDATDPVALAIDLRPAHLDVESGSFESERNFLMNADLTAAVRSGAWTVLAEVGRQPRGDDVRIASFEHWASWTSERGLGVRAGRFLPAYGVKLADHTTFTRATLGLDNDDQLYAAELSFTGSRHLVQVSLGPGPADALFDDDDGRRAFTASGRWQIDVRPRTVVVASGLLRAASDRESRSGATGLAAGFAPFSRLTLWTQADVRFRDDAAGPRAYTVLGDAAFEAWRGVWLRFTPQLRTEFGDSSAGTRRLALGLNLLPRTHWNVILNWYHDRNRSSGRTTKTLLAQLHLYL